jgi:hypothetical protein
VLFPPVRLRQGRFPACGGRVYSDYIGIHHQMDKVIAGL